MDILELLKGQISGPVMEQMGGLLGLDAAQAQSIGQAVLPAQVAALTEKAGTEAGAQQLLDLAAQVPQGSPQELLASPQGLEQLRQSGTALLPQLLGNQTEDAVQQVAARTGAGQGHVQGMMQMILPLVLGVVGQQASGLGLNAGSLSNLFSGGVGGVGGLGGAAAAGLNTGAGTLGQGASALGAGLQGGMGNAAAGIGASAAGLGAAATEGMATVGEGAGLNGGVLHSNPALGGRKGLGWLWLLPLLLLLLLFAWFLLRGKPAESATATEPASAAASVAPGQFAIGLPAADSMLPAGAFEMKGSGKPGDVLEIFEDGVSLGKVTVGADGSWSLNVPSPAAGAHTYTVKGQGGTELGSVKASIAAAAVSTAACTKAFSLSIPDGQSVAQPFRFGGVGSGKSYTVTVMRGERKIGTKVMPLDGTCGYSYTSKPGQGTISYSVSQTGSAEVAGKITLTVR